MSTPIPIEEVATNDAGPATDASNTNAASGVTITQDVAAEEAVQVTEPLKIVRPHASATSKACDVCGTTAALQTISFSVTQANEQVIYICTSKKCQDQLKQQLVQYYAETDQIPFSVLYESLPVLLDTNRSWTVRRSSDGAQEDGWKVLKNWRANFALNTFKKLRGEPWWRIPLKNGDKIRYTMVHELQDLNTSALDEGVWSMLPTLLPEVAEDSQPTEEFLKHYVAEAWYLKEPSDALLSQYRI